MREAQGNRSMSDQSCWQRLASPDYGVPIPNGKTSVA